MTKYILEKVDRENGVMSVLENMNNF